MSEKSNNSVVVFGVLVARDESKLRVVADDARVRGAQVEQVVHPDLADLASLDELLSEVTGCLPSAQNWYFFQGALPDQQACEQSWEVTQRAIDVNFTGIAKLVTLVANQLEEQGAGKIIVVSSVAGLRGRKSNYVYGTAKGALHLYLQGLRNRLASSNVGVLTVMPGFIITPMTEGMNRKGLLWASAEKVGSDIFKAQSSGRNVLYTPWFWRFVMLVIVLIPENIFKRLSL